MLTAKKYIETTRVGEYESQAYRYIKINCGASALKIWRKKQQN